NIKVLNTIKENDLVIHIVNKLPDQTTSLASAKISINKRRLTENNHTATHLMHAALREVLGEHVQQKGSLVNDKYFRFDFSHFQKMTDEEIQKVERRVNEKIRENVPLDEARSIPIEEAKASGAMMLFGEKYGDSVRMITFDPSFSRELCGGCHVDTTGKIGLFKITSEGAIAAGVRRIEAITSIAAEEFIGQQLATLSEVKAQFKNPKNLAASIAALIEENKTLKKKIEQLQIKEAGSLKADLLKQVQNINGIQFLNAVLPISDSKAIKNLVAQLDKELENAFIVFGAKSGEKAQIMVSINRALTETNQLHAGNIVKELAKEINGGGGGQAFYATAGGSNPAGLESAINKAKTFIE
ncbi:MAG: DHHA1 domain-containing protein, partial [Bacteroidota bacterium]